MVPTDREVRRRGAVIAASLGLAWLITAAGTHSTFDYLLQSLLYNLPVLLLVTVIVMLLLFVIAGNAADASRRREHKLSSTDPEGGGRGSDGQPR